MISDVKPNEVRLMNWVIFTYPNYNYPVEPKESFIAIEDFASMASYDLVIKPIPLTEEWLLKFGFEKNDEIATDAYEFPLAKDGSRMGLFFLKKIVTAVNHTTYFNLSFPGKHGSCYMPSFNQCQYVHQLQNLYFALTQTELEIK